MKCYLITYDLNRIRDYEEIHSAIKSLGAWAKITESNWAVVSEKTAVEIRDFLLTHVDEDDSIFVIKSGQEAAWRNVKCKNEWLKDNLVKT